MKFTSALITLTLASVSSAQDFSSIISSALSVASSWVAENDMNEIVSSGLAEASSWAAENDINSIFSSVGAEYGITDTNAVSEAWAQATVYFESITDAIAAGNISDLLTATEMPSIASATGAEAASVTGDNVSPTASAAASEGGSDGPVETLSSMGGAGGWATPGAAGIGSLFLGLVAYL